MSLIASLGTRRDSAILSDRASISTSPRWRKTSAARSGPSEIRSVTALSRPDMPEAMPGGDATGAAVPTGAGAGTRSVIVSWYVLIVASLVHPELHLLRDLLRLAVHEL